VRRTRRPATKVTVSRKTQGADLGLAAAASAMDADADEAAAVVKARTQRPGMLAASHPRAIAATAAAKLAIEPKIAAGGRRARLMSRRSRKMSMRSCTSPPMPR
jgi:hypothetical protein